MPLETVGTIACPACGETVRVFRRGFLIDNRPIFAIALHWQGADYCPGMGKRVKLAEVTQ